MVDLLLGIPGPVAGPLVVLAAVALALAAFGRARRRFPAADLRAGNEVTAVVYTLVGGLYAVLLAFVVVAVWEDYRHAEAHVEHEVTRLGTLFRDAEVLPEPSRTEIRDALLGYARSVVADEWRTMARGEASERTRVAYDRIWAAYYRTEAGTGAAAVFYEQSVDRLGQVGESRRARILASRSGVPATLWVLLVAGGVVVVGLTFVFGSAHAGTHRVAVATLAAVVASVLFVTLALDRPFGAGISLSRRPFAELVEQWSAS